MDKNTLKDVKLPQDKLNSIYRGVVEDNVDPLKAGRCKVRIFGIHTSMKTKSATEGIPTSELPWAQPALSLIEGSISKYGLFGVPLQGSHVFVFFEAGNIMQPRYFARAPAIPTEGPMASKGFNDPAGVYPDKVGQPDWNAGYGVYPHSVILSVHSGHYMEFDSTPGNEKITLFHCSGTYIEVDKDGNVLLSCIADKTEGVGGNKIAQIGGDWDITTGGDVSIKAVGNITLTSQNIICVGDVTTTKSVSVGNGANGSFDAGNKNVTVQDGIVVSIV